MYIIREKIGVFSHAESKNDPFITLTLFIDGVLAILFFQTHGGVCVTPIKCFEVKLGSQISQNIDLQLRC